MTAQELLRHRNVPYRHELVAGRLREMEPTGMRHGAVAAGVVRLLANHVTDRALGVVFATEAGFLLSCDPDTVRAPDASFVTRERIEAAGIPSGYWPGPPDLAVEVVSPGDGRSGVRAKALEWIDAGTRAVVVLDPQRRTAAVYRSGEETRELEGDARMELGDVVPGFAPRVGDLFV